MASAPDDSGLFVFNGINGATGKYLTPPTEPKTFFEAARATYTDKKRPVEADTLARVISGGKGGERHLKELKARVEAGMEHFGVRPGIDSGKLEEAGWGILFVSDADPAVKDALKEL